MALMAGTALSVAGGGSSAVYAEDGKVWGAAELDFRMYVCGATGKFCPAMTKVKVAPARQIDEALAQDIASIPQRVFETSFSKRGALMVNPARGCRAGRLCCRSLPSDVASAACTEQEIARICGRHFGDAASRVPEADRI